MVTEESRWQGRSLNGHSGVFMHAAISSRRSAMTSATILGVCPMRLYVCMYVCTYVYMYVYMYVCMCMCIYARAHTPTPTHTPTHKHRHRHTHTHIQTHKRTHACMHSFIHTYIHTYMHACICDHPRRESHTPQIFSHFLSPLFSHFLSPRAHVHSLRLLPPPALVNI